MKYGTVLSVSEKKEVCAYTDQFPVAFQQYIVNDIFLLQNKLIS
jgi:hypothetical protein